MTAMILYRCFFVDPPRGFVGSEEFYCGNDAEAVVRAATLARERGYRSLGFELWQGNRLVRPQEPIDRSS